MDLRKKKPRRLKKETSEVKEEIKKALQTCDSCIQCSDRSILRLACLQVTNANKKILGIVRRQILSRRG